MKILYLAHRIPYPPNKGDKIRSFNEIRVLAQKHEIDLICLADDPKDLSGAVPLRALCKQVHVCGFTPFRAKLKGIVSLLKGRSISSGYFYHTAVQRVFDQWVVTGGYDAILCFSSPMAEYLFRSKALRQLEQSDAGKRPQRIMDFCDVDSDKWRQFAESARFPMDIVYRTENRRLAAFERRVYQSFDYSLLVSDNEAALFRKICPDDDKIAVVRNGVDHVFFAPLTDPGTEKPSSSGPVLVFTGAMDYHANIDGVQWFCLKVLPKLLARFPGLRFLIVGSNPTPAVQSLDRLPGVEVTGFVDDIRDYYSIADVCVVPLRLARGVQNKVLEAMAMGKAVVTTSRANDGIQAEDGTHLLIADSAEDFALAVIGLLADRQANRQLAEQARAFVIEHYDWQRNMEGLSNMFSALSGQPLHACDSIKEISRLQTEPKTAVCSIPEAGF